MRAISLSDAFAPDAPNRGVARVIVFTDMFTTPLTGAIPMAGVPVVFSTADGAMVEVVETDAQGVAEAEVARNSTATVVRNSRLSARLETMYGIQPGESYHFGETWTPRPRLATMTFIFARPPVGLEYYYRLFTPRGKADGFCEQQIVGKLHR